MMNEIKEIKDILLNKSNYIGDTKLKSISTDKNGVLDDLELNLNKSLTMVEAFDNLNHLVEVKQYYPNNDQSTVQFDIDLVLLQGKDYRRILNLLNGAIKTR